MENRKRPLAMQIRKKRHCYAFLAPYFIFFILFTVLPVFTAISLSTTYYNMLEPPQFIGLANYTKMFFYDDVFIKALMNTLTMAVFIGPIGYLAALMFAWMINELSHNLRTLLVFLIYAPSIPGNLYFVWTIIFSGDSYGYINGMLLNAQLIDQPIQWFTDPSYMMPVIIIISIWMNIGTSFLSFVAGLQGIDESLYEAGAIDGIHNRWQELWFITLPAMKPQLLFGAVMSITGAFAVGDLTMNLCGLPSTDYAVHTILNHITDYVDTRYEMGYACALATVLFLLMVVSNKLIQRLLRKVGD